MRRSLQSLAGLTVLAAALSAGAARADNNISSSFSGGACDGLDCNAHTTIGSLTGRNVGADFASRVSTPWVAKFWAEYNECFRVQVTKYESGTQMRLILIAPDGLVIKRIGVKEDVIVIADPGSPNRTGFWTAIVTLKAGEASQTEFAFTLGRYVKGNAANCHDDPNTYFVR
jgi:hypothetical protein